MKVRSIVIEADGTKREGYTFELVEDHLHYQAFTRYSSKLNSISYNYSDGSIYVIERVVE